MYTVYTNQKKITSSKLCDLNYYTTVILTQLAIKDTKQLAKTLEKKKFMKKLRKTSTPNHLVPHQTFIVGSNQTLNSQYLIRKIPIEFRSSKYQIR